MQYLGVKVSKTSSPKRPSMTVGVGLGWQLCSLLGEGTGVSPAEPQSTHQSSQRHGMQHNVVPAL